MMNIDNNNNNNNNDNNNNNNNNNSNKTLHILCWFPLQLCQIFKFVQVFVIQVFIEILYKIVVFRLEHTSVSKILYYELFTLIL